MPLYELTPDRIVAVPEARFAAVELRERQDLQRLLRDHLEVIAPQTMLLAEEFGSWEESRRRIDLLGLDKEARLVVIELKRTEDGGHMELQAIRYAAMISQMTFGQAVEAHDAYLRQRGGEGSARERILGFLGWEEPDDEAFAADVRLVLVSANFSKEITSSVLWLREFGVDITCLRLIPYDLQGRTLIDVQRIIPLPEAADFMERVRNKERAERESRGAKRDYTRYDVVVDGERHTAQFKRRAILLVVRALCSKGVTPAQIVEVVDWRENNLFRSYAGTLDQDAFRAAGRAEVDAGGLVLDPSRWFCDDGELIHSGGNTYALSSQWGLRTGEALTLLTERWPRLGIEVHVSEG